MRYKTGLMLILGLAIYFRVSGVKPGFPDYHSDEGITYSAAVAMVKNNNLDPLRYDYPSITPLANYFFYKAYFLPMYWTKYYLSHMGDIFDGVLQIPMDETTYTRVLRDEILGNRGVNALFWSRGITAIFGVGVVYLVWRLGATAFDEKVGLVAALMVAVNYREVLNSHLGLPDIYNAFFLLLSMLFTWRMWQKPTRSNYVLAAIVAGISFSVKYQFFAFLPLLVAHLGVSYSQENVRAKVGFLFAKRAFLVPLIIAIVFWLLNPYHFIKYEETIAWVSSVSRKYRTGRMMLDFFPYSYLYHYGLGKVTSWLVLLGVMTSVWKKRWRVGLMLGGVVAMFLFFVTYYTGGGFYTRNLVTIIPVMLILAGAFWVKLLGLLKWNVWKLVMLAVLLMAVWENVEMSVVVAREYRNPWNYKVLESWIADHFSNEVVAAHPFVRLPKGVERTSYDFASAFSIEEFRDDGASWAVANLDYATDHFYWWMTQSTKQSLEFWEKPVGILREMYPALAIEEAAQFSVYSALNDWRAPDTGFLVVKVPEYSYEREQLLFSYDFEESQQGWGLGGVKFGIDDNYVREDGSLVIKRKPTVAVTRRWASASKSVDGAQGLIINSRIRTDSEVEGFRDGYVMIRFYRGGELVGLRLGARKIADGEWGTQELVVNVPEGAEKYQVEFGMFNTGGGEARLDSLEIYSAQVGELGEVEYSPVKLDENIVFHNSHGNL